MKIKSLLLTMVLAFVGVSAFAQWQWVDKDGRKVYSDRAPPPEVLEKNILKRPANAPKTVQPEVLDAASTGEPKTAGALPAAATGLKITGQDKDLEAKKKQAADAEAAKLKAEQERITKTKIENCARAKQAKATFDSGIRISRTNASGEREIMDEATRAAELKRIQNVMESDCN